MWEARRIAKGEDAGRWGLLYQRIRGGWASDDDGNRVTFRTKQEAEAERRSRERELSPRPPQAKGEIFREKALRKRLTRKRSRPIIQVSAGPTQGRKDHGEDSG